MGGFTKLLVVLFSLGLFSLAATSSKGQSTPLPRSIDAYSGASDGDSDCDEDAGCEEEKDDGDIDCGCSQIGAGKRASAIRLLLSLS